MSLDFSTVFLGTPEFSCPILEALARETRTVLVVSQPDRPVGRGRRIEPPPVKVTAERLGIEVIQPKVVKGRRFAARIAEYEPDFIITAAFGRLLGPSLLKVPARDSLNVHASLLPGHRGAAPINWAILSGDQETGVSIMRMEEGLDSGPVYQMVKTPIGSEETAGELSMRLSTLGADALVDTLRRFDELEAVPQLKEGITWARMLKKSSGTIDWTMSATQIHCQVRGMNPWPSATTWLRKSTLKIHVAKILSENAVSSSGGDRPGLVLNVSNEGIDVACGGGVLRLIEVQAPGRKRLKVANFLAGTKIEPGVMLGE